jgi:hypothetical protein
VIAAAFSDDLVVGMVFGFLLGLLFAPALRSWVSWREWLRASREADRAAREADLMAEMLELMDGDRATPAAEERDAASVAPRVHGRPLRGSWRTER